MTIFAPLPEPRQLQKMMPLSCHRMRTMTPQPQQEGEYMARITTNKNTSTATIADVIAWANQSNVSRDTIYELRKIAPRMDLTEQDLTIVSADINYFESIIAQSPYGTVSNASNLDAAHKRGNSRIRRCLEKFHNLGREIKPNRDSSYSALIQAIKAREGFIARGYDFNTGRHLSLYTLRRTSTVALAELDQEEVNRLFADTSSETRKSLRKAILLINELREGYEKWPEIAAILPTNPLQVPQRDDQNTRILWKQFTTEFRKKSEALFNEILVNPQQLAQTVRQMLDSGSPSEEINAYVAKRTSSRTKISANNAAAITSYRAALTWVAKTYLKDQSITSLIDPIQLFDRALLKRSIDEQIARSKKSLKLKDADKSCTLTNRIVALKTIARHGLKLDYVINDLEALTRAYSDFIIKQREMTDEADAICSALLRNPRLAARLVNAPLSLAKVANKKAAAAKDSGDTLKELNALRLFAVAALYAIQLSRPLRTRNLITLRHRATVDLKANVNWIKNGKHAKIRFEAIETKNQRQVNVTLLGDDAQILWDWQTVHRKRFVQLSGCGDSPYLFPGKATPRLVRNGLKLPTGTMASSSFAELWSKGDQVIGLRLTPHSCRHVIATLVLAKEPGNFAKAAAVLADTEATVRKHYGKDSGENAAAAVRRVLLEEYPGLFKKIGGRR